jgi:hypothetical protein
VSGSLEWDYTDESLNFISGRLAENHYNVWSLINPPFCSNCVQIQVLQHLPDLKYLKVNVAITNPTNITGYNVRGVVDFDDSTQSELILSDGYWHSMAQAIDEFPSPYRGFGWDEPDMAFGPGQQHSEVYEFAYQSLGDFSKAEYRVIARYPQFPGEVTGISVGDVNGAVTISGGFLSVGVEVEKTVNCPAYTVEAKLVVDEGESEVKTMRERADDSYVTWFEGIPSTGSVYRIWIFAKVEGSGENYEGYEYSDLVDTGSSIPSREFPQVGDGVSVYLDQLTTQMTDQQKEFMATNAEGSQKLVKNLVDSLRSYNPDFLNIQYHLAFGSGDISNIHGNDWIKNWEFENAQEDFFEHRTWSTQPGNRVLQQDWNWYLTDPSGEWANYFIGNTLERMNPLGDQFDGIFADSASQPWNTDPAQWWEGENTAPAMFGYWTPKTQDFFDKVTNACHTLPQYIYLIPNAGSFVTTISDITYYQCDGVMIEGFSHWSAGNYFTEPDWKLQMNRIRDLATMDKIILCQTDIDIPDTADRSFVIGSYFLVHDNYTYLNMLGVGGLQPEWYPEYSWIPGGEVEDWTDIDELLDSGGCFVRNFANGIVIVNPSDEFRTFTTTQQYSHTMFAGGGYLPEDGVPTGVVTGPIVDPGAQEIAPHSSWLGLII